MGVYSLLRVAPIAALLLLVAACRPDSSTAVRIPEGTWIGALTPQNHPEMQTPVGYQVRYARDRLQVDLVGPGGDTMATRRPRLDGDTLRFAFQEPEEQVVLTCALGREARDGEALSATPVQFAGRCTDPNGQWARFTMRHTAGG